MIINWNTNNGWKQNIYVYELHLNENKIKLCEISNEHIMIINDIIISNIMIWLKKCCKILVPKESRHDLDMLLRKYEIAGCSVVVLEDNILNIFPFTSMLNSSLVPSVDTAITVLTI